MACTDMTIRLEVDGLATGSSASEKSRSLELLLTLHTLVGAAVLQRTNELQQLRSRTLRDAPAGWTVACSRAHVSRPCHSRHVELVSSAAGPRESDCTRAPRYFGQYPVQYRSCFFCVFQWEFIFVRHYVRMWFTSCMIVGLDR